MVNRIPSGGIQRPLERRRWNVDRIGSLSVRLYRVSGKVLVRGSGEVAVDVTFPVTFIEEPVLSFGAALEANQALEAGNFPTISVVATGWNRREKVVGGEVGFYYDGATLSIVTTGKTDQLIWVHWSAEAKAFRNPDSGDLGSLEDPI